LSLALKGDFHLSEISSPDGESALPPSSGGLDVNHCKNPKCLNFGVPAEIVRWRRKHGTVVALTPGKAYSLRASGKKRPVLYCLLCHESFSVKSNLAVAEERDRLIAYLTPRPPDCCETSGCVNETVPVGTAGAYYRHGTTPGGTPRWRCRACGKAMAIGGRAIKRQRLSHLNKTILLELTNKMAIRRICKVNGISPSTLYGKIEFFERQCLAFAGARERALKTLPIRRLHLSVDRADYMVNWAYARDARNIYMRAMASADNVTGYVFGMHLAFDSSLDRDVVEADATRLNDRELGPAHRRYARLWLASDLAESLAASAAEAKRKASAKPRENLGDDIEVDYLLAAAREDSEVSDQKSRAERLPDKHGVAVHDEYTLYAHFFYLRHLLGNVGKFRFYLDRDSGMRAGFMAAFKDLVIERRADAFYVKTDKEMTVQAKRKRLKTAEEAYLRFAADNPGLGPFEVQLMMMKVSIARSVEIGKWHDRWCAHPRPSMQEPSKAACWLTDLGDYDVDHQARLFLKASLNGVDNFFQRVRRSLNPLERPIKTSSKAYRAWHGYSPYNPRMVERLLNIYRVIHNFVEVGKDGKTAAMRLGLTASPTKVEEILYFQDTGGTISATRARGTKARKKGSSSTYA
jgi:transposase-like protein